MFASFGSLRRLSSLTAIGSSLRNSLYVVREESRRSVKKQPEGCPPDDSTKEEEDGEIVIELANGGPRDADNGEKKSAKKTIFQQLDAADVSIHF